MIVWVIILIRSLLGMIFKIRVLLIWVIGFHFSCITEKKADDMILFKIKRIKSNVGLLEQYKGDIVRGHSLKIYHDSTFVSYINVTKSILLYSNLSTAKPKFKIISLPISIVNDPFYGMIQSFSIDYDSTITIFQEKRISLYNFNTKELIYEKDISRNDSTKIFFVDHHFPVYHDQKRNVIYSQIVHTIDKEKRKFPYDAEFLAQINISSGTVSFVPLKFPESYNKGELGKNSVMKVAFKGDSIICSSTNEPYFSIYDSQNNSIVNKACESVFHKEMKKLPLDSIWNGDLDEEKHIQSFRYEDILYDDYNKMYYRVYTKEMKLKNDSGYYNTFLDREKGIVVLDSEFKRLGEIELPDKEIFWYGVGRDGFYYLNSIDIINDSLYKKYVSITPLP